MTTARPLLRAAPTSRAEQPPTDKDRERAVPPTRAATDLKIPARPASEVVAADRRQVGTYPVDPRDLPYRMVGRLFYRAETIPSEVFWGTAAVVGTAGIITAAHNLYDRGTQEWFDDWWFYPAWGDEDEMPYGAWRVEFVGLNPTFVHAADHKQAYGYDVGFARMNPDSSGRNLATVVGGQLPVSLTPPTPATGWAAIGYELLQGAGYTMMRCDGDYQPSYSTTTTWAKEDDLPEGSSGGPWWQLPVSQPTPAINGLMSQRAEGAGLAKSSAFGTWVPELQRAVLGS